MGIEMLGRRYVPEILLELRERPDQSKIQLATRLGHTRTINTRLDELERVEEIARILGGIEITSAQRDAAREMIEEYR